MNKTEDIAKQAIPQDILEEAAELARGAEILPDGVNALAAKIWQARKEGRPLRVKLGIDPTSTDLHVGHAVCFRKLSRFQKFGHQIVVIIGGFTAQIGDPTGRNSTRPPLTADDVAVNAKTYLDQMGSIIDLNKAEVTNNGDWLAPLNLNDLIKLASKVTVNQMLAKEAFGSRIEQQLPVHLHELFYPILQGYDSVAIKSDIELGGTDQRFNILAGRELQGHYGQSQQLAMLLPLLEGTDGVQKMSKSYNNYIGLKEIPDDMFGKCMRIPDNLIIKYFEMTTDWTGAEIDKLKAELAAGANPKDAKEKLAWQIVCQYHNKDIADKALLEWTRVHSERQVPEEIPSHVVTADCQLFRIMVESKLTSGTGEAKRLIQEGAVRLDGEQVREPNAQVTISKPEGVVLQVGRRKFVRLVNK
ncbi:MAG: tyrosine--tRNA ligase [Candidatus Obscuribacterales bacterium]|nr:tyrosine--tRNA ligase [Candidatus Obscuribacterales bacterium]